MIKTEFKNISDDLRIKTIIVCNCLGHISYKKRLLDFDYDD